MTQIVFADTKARVARPDQVPHLHGNFDFALILAYSAKCSNPRAFSHSINLNYKAPRFLV